MYIDDYIEEYNEENDHPYIAATLLKWINRVEANVYDSIIKSYTNKHYARVTNEFQYSLPSGVTINDVVSLYVNGVRYQKKDVRAYKEYRSFWYEDSKLCIYPVNSSTDTEYESGEDEITFTTSTIVTTGDDFAFSTGDVIEITGCADTDNDKTATILEVDTDTLTFASGTFEAGEETAAITIQKVTIKLTYKEPTTAKVIANITTDELIIPDIFTDIYDFYLDYMIAYKQKEYSEAANHKAMYNARVAEYEEWWEDNRPARPEDDIVAEEDGSFCESDTLDFDNE